MKAIDLYKFITDNDIEYSYAMNGGNEDVLIFPYFSQIEDFYKILSKSVFDDECIICNMKDGYFAFWMNDICEYHDIELGDVFKK